ncbi:MAG TPA: type I methionyl aminopeptidase [Firmicutes bacterium]|nr:type I methionyl aminopeptidase [Bacillota bacterium]
MIVLKSLQEIELMRQAGRIVGEVLYELSQAVKPGITTAQLDILAVRCIRKNNAEPAFLGYNGFPASICVSVNEELVHGIPGLRRLKNGDIVSIDVGVHYKGYYGDAAATFPVGKVSSSAAQLIEVTRESLNRAIKKAIPGNRLYDISYAVQSYVESQGFSVIRSYVGHGIGSRLHEEPQVPNFGMPGKGPLLEPGMVLAIEPMVSAGTWEVETLGDQWTVVTRDRSLSAHFEHSVAILEDGPKILTSFSGR